MPWVWKLQSNCSLRSELVEPEFECEVQVAFSQMESQGCNNACFPESRLRLRLTLGLKVQVEVCCFIHSFPRNGFRVDFFFCVEKAFLSMLGVRGLFLVSFCFLRFSPLKRFCGTSLLLSGEAPCGAHVFEGFFRSRKWAREIGQKPGEDVVWQRNAGRRQPPPQAHFISPNPPRHSRKSVSDGVIQLRVPLAGCAGFFLQAPIPRRILTKMSEAICCMNMRFAKRSWEHPCF